MTKLLLFYENFLADACSGVGSISKQSSRETIPEQWIDEVSKHYTSYTLRRLLQSCDGKTRRAATWALFFHGDESHYRILGMLLRDPLKSVRRSADEARRAIARRTQSPWHRKTAIDVEQKLADGQYRTAEELAGHLVEETVGRWDAFALRAFVRLVNGQVHKAIEDCKESIRLDPFSYQAYVALGQCYWHLNMDGPARECFAEATRIYPDSQLARTSLRSVSSNL